ncbi:GNAT family N-acetyltransferase [Dactylosporangium sp. CA-052675]|uniref:GNAT family N-acetyltransferase n=1 Tax=Dactylosporangium sp. CA-052675 TaxID=3239927 RepID=UPI003D8E9617
MRELTSDRLRLREWRDDDAPFVLDMGSRWEVRRYLGATPRLLTDLDDARATIASWRGHDDGVHGVWSIRRREDDAPLGTLLLIGILASGPDLPLRPSGETEIGWHLHPDAWGHGYATEAAGLVLRQGYFDEVLAVTYPQNAASQAVCRRLGMHHLGRTDRYYNMTCELFSTTPPR